MKIYQKTWFIWVMLLFVTPVGLFLLWQYSGYSTKVKVIISAWLGLTFVWWLKNIL